MKKSFSLLDCIKFPLKHATLQSVICILEVIITALIPTFQIVVNAQFINTTISYFNQGAELSSVLGWLALVVILIAVQWISGIIVSKQWSDIELILMEKVRSFVVEKQAKLEYVFFEDSKKHDLILRVCKEPEKHIVNTFRVLMKSFSLAVRILGILAILLTQIWWSAIIILAFSIPMFYISFKGSQTTYEVGKEVTNSRRKRNYFFGATTGRESADERTLFQFEDYFVDLWYSHFENARKLEYGNQKKWFIKLEASTVCTALVSVGVILVLINPVASGAITFGIFTSIIHASFNLVQIMSWDFNDYVDNLVSESEYLKEFREFMCLGEKQDALVLPDHTVPFESLSFENVRFKYENGDQYVLDGLSFQIEKGRHYAFVGKNGVGKTTVIKLLTGLYDNYEGVIKLNGKDIKSYLYKDIKGLFSIVFQDYAKYGLTVKENIAIGDMTRDVSDSLIKKQIDELLLTNDINALPNKLDTVLGRMTEEGVDLSGGQWQKIAIARNMVSTAPIKILDEPTASLDPVAEHTLFNKFGSITKDSTTILISHRLGSTQNADEIFVFDDGKIIESGSYDELMRKNGLYSVMYNSQADWYIQEKNIDNEQR